MQQVPKRARIVVRREIADITDHATELGDRSPLTLAMADATHLCEEPLARHLRRMDEVTR